MAVSAFHRRFVDIDRAIALPGMARPETLTFVCLHAIGGSICTGVRSRGVSLEADAVRAFPQTSDCLAAGVADNAEPNGDKPGEVYHSGSGGRGVYFPDPDGHNMEILTCDLASRRVYWWNGPGPIMRFPTRALRTFGGESGHQYALVGGSIQAFTVERTDESWLREASTR